MKRSLIALALTGGLLGSARADEAPLTYIATQELAAKMRVSPRTFTVIDARARVEYDEAHIPGAISVPAPDVAVALPKQIKDRRRELIFYCNGPKCTKSQKAARAAIALGYRNVLEYNEGMPGWGKAKMPIAGTPLSPVDVPAVAAGDLAARLKSGKHPFILDLRDAQEFNAYHLKGAINIPLDEVEKRLREIPKGGEIVIACHAGQQSIVGARLLHHLGIRIDGLRRLDGGILAWQQKGLPLEGNPSAAHL
jgi:rhodanese-related sulfurtransferase